MELAFDASRGRPNPLRSSLVLTDNAREMATEIHDSLLGSGVAESKARRIALGAALARAHRERWPVQSEELLDIAE